MTNILILGEAYGEEEEKQRTAFVGYSGHELTRMLDEAGIHRSECFLTNVFNQRPPANKVEWFCGSRDEAIPGYPSLTKSKYVRQEFAHELDRLRDEILACNPNILVALGNTASWALLGRTAISKYRGTTEISTHTAPGYKTLATYHPAAVTRQWELRPVTVLDLMKAARESEYPELRRTHREVWIEPTLEDLYEFRKRYLESGTVAVDIETSGDQITCIGFGTRSVSLVIPTRDSRKKSRSYWATDVDEREAWEFVRQVLGDTKVKKIFQNGLFDVSFLWRAYGIRVMGAEHDTMLLHHALQPEALKGLGFLGSIYCDEGAWKEMREKVTTIKRDE